MANDATKIFSAPPHSEAGFHTPAPTYPAAEYNAVLAMTERLFPGPVDVRHESDPEIAGHHYLDLNVVAHGALEDIMARDAQWRRELLQIAPGLPNVYCLNIDIGE